MRDIPISFTIPYSDFVLGTLLLVFAIVLYLAISKNWEWLQSRPNPLPWMAEHYVALLLPLGFIAISLAIYFWIWDIRGEIGRLVALLSSQTTPADIRNLAYAIAALLGAVALAATIPFQLIKVWVNERLAKTTEQGHMTDRITKAVEQLGAEKTVWEGSKQKTVANLEVRLGAIYALERIAQDSLRDHIPVMEILTAYVRHNAPAGKAHALKLDYEDEDWKQTQRVEIRKIPEPKIDIQTIITVIGRRKAKHIKFERDANANVIKSLYRLDLRSTNLQRLDLSYLNFNNAIIVGAELQGANLGRAKLQGAYLMVAKLQGANLGEAELQKAYLTRVALQGADLREAEFQGANLIEAELQGADLTGAKLQGADLREAEFDKDTNFTDANLQLASVKFVDLTLCHTLSDEQIQPMFGDASTTRPNHLQKPNWAEWEPSEQEYFGKWQAAKGAANL